jgi:hypothetical protein
MDNQSERHDYSSLSDDDSVLNAEALFLELDRIEAEDISVAGLLDGADMQST